MTLTTVGYGDVGAQNNDQRLLGIFAMIVGALVFAYGVSEIVHIIDDLRAESKAFKARMDKFNQYMAYRKVSHPKPNPSPPRRPASGPPSLPRPSS